MEGDDAVPTNWMKLALAEAIGTFALVFIGVLSISGARIAGAPDGLASLASIGALPMGSLSP